MIYPPDFESKAGFDRIRYWLAKFVLSPLGHKRIDKMHFLDDFRLIIKQLERVSEMMGFFQTGQVFPEQDYIDMTHELERLSIPGTYPDPESLFQLKLSLETIIGIKRFIEKQSVEKNPELAELSGELKVDPALMTEMVRILDDKGRIRDSASVRLKEIRKSISQKYADADIKLTQILQVVKKEGWTGENTEIAVRNGRQVIPLASAYKRKIRGFIHDVSATGQTVYVEPDEVFDINNEIRELQGAEKREIVIILTAFAKQLRPEIPVLLHAYEILGEFDFLRAVAKFAITINAIVPDMDDSPLVDWKEAVHPLLQETLVNQGGRMVPLNITLGNDERLLVISGPNAGGKSIALKTVCLLQYMLQCGIPIPVKENSKAGIFKKMFLDIGDEQSIERNLSTYTSHLINMKVFIENSDPSTLVFIDEFGTGSEPRLGGAIAEATLEALAKSKCCGIITTHYANLKEAAGRIPGCFNGAMLFDPSSLSPLFILKTGKPGSSFTFEIAQKIGFPENVLESAMAKTDMASVNYEKLLLELEHQRNDLKKSQEKARVADEFFNELITKYNNLFNQLEAQKKEILLKAKQDAAILLRDVNSKIEKAIRDIKAHASDKEHIRKVRAEIDIEKKRIEEDIVSAVVNEELPTEETTETGISLTIGMKVRIKGQNLVGRIIEIRENDVVVEVGNLIFHVSHDKLMPAKASDKETIPSVATSSRHSIYQDISDKAANFKLSIDVRGKAAEEALKLIGRYIDDAVLLNIPEVTIIHGKGYGILREAILKHLKSIPEVKSLAEGHPDRGGAGMTIVSFRR